MGLLTSYFISFARDFIVHGMRNSVELDDIVYSISSDDTYDIDKILEGRGQ